MSTKNRTQAGDAAARARGPEDTIVIHGGKSPGPDGYSVRPREAPLAPPFPSPESMAGGDDEVVVLLPSDEVDVSQLPEVEMLADEDSMNAAMGTENYGSRFPARPTENFLASGAVGSLATARASREFTGTSRLDDDQLPEIEDVEDITAIIDSDECLELEAPVEPVLIPLGGTRVQLQGPTASGARWLRVAALVVVMLGLAAFALPKGLELLSERTREVASVSLSRTSQPVTEATSASAGSAVLAGGTHESSEVEAAVATVVPVAPASVRTWLAESLAEHLRSVPSPNH